MAFPKTLDELKAAGYVFETFAICKSPACRAEIEFWKTPTGKMMPIDPMKDGGGSKVISHWSTCKDAKGFRK